MNKVAQLLLVAVAAGAGGGALVWLKVKPAPPQPIIVEVHSIPGHAVETTASPKPRNTNPPQASPAPTARPLRGAFPDTVIAAAPGSVGAAAKPDERSDAPSSPERVVVNQTSINQAVVNRIVSTPTSGAPPEKPTQQPPPDVPAGEIEDALSYALEAADPYVKQGFTVREDYWGGGLPAKGTKAIVQQLFKGNEYWFWTGTALKGAKVVVHIYDAEGDLAETDQWQRSQMAGARVTPKKTGSYYLIVSVEQAPPGVRVPWALTYGFR
jgi:hypothetical protein